MVPLGCQVGHDAVSRPRKGESSNPEDQEDDVGEQGSDVDHLPGGLDALKQADGHQEPRGKQGSCRIDPRVALKHKGSFPLRNNGNKISVRESFFVVIACP